MENKQKTILITTGIALLAAMLGAKYFQGFYFLIVMGAIIFTFATKKKNYLMYFFALVFWFPKSFNYIFLKDVFYGAFASEVFLYFILVFYLLIEIVRGRGDVINNIFKTPFLGFLVLFVIGGFISYILGDAPDNQLAYVFFRKNCIYGPVIYLVAANFIKDKYDAEKTFIFLVMGLAALAAFVFYSFYFNQNLLVEAFSEERLGGIFSVGKTTLGVTCMMLAGQFAIVIPISFALYLLSNKKYQKLIGAFSFIVLVSSLAGTLTRSAWAAAAIGVFIVMLLGYKNKPKGRVFNIFLILFLSAVVLVVFIMTFYWLGLDENIFNRFQTLKYAKEDISLLDRVSIWSFSLITGVQHPLGMGFREAYPLGQVFAYPHNIYVGSLLSVGLLGTFGFFAFIAGWIKKVLSCLKALTDIETKLILIGAFASISAFLFYGIFEHIGFFVDTALTASWIILGVSAGIFRNCETQQI